ncbi:MAG: DegV family protein [Anaerolineae bacterium]|nr:DegV family protein [Anaerolineae bacterium]
MTQKVGLVVDSTTDLPQEWLDKWQIVVTPAFINWGSESYPDDGVAFTKAEFYQRLATSPDLPRTSAMPPGLAQEAIKLQLERYEHVVVIGVASQFSSIYNTLKLAAQQIDPNRTTAYDSGSVSMGLGWQVAAGAEVAADGGTPDQVLAAMRSTRERVKLYAAIDTLEFLRRGGRVSTLVAGLGTLLQIKPIIDVHEGEVHTFQRQRTTSRAIAALVEAASAYGPLEKLAVLHSVNYEGAEDLQQRLSAVAPADTIIVEVTPAIGVHVGPKCLGVSFVKK